MHLLPARTRPYTAVSFCSGIGGLDLAFDRADFEITAQVEINEFCHRILEREWPDALRLRDMRECGAHNLPWADVFFGGIPCQPHSTAGKRTGAEDDRNLWPDFRRIVGELRPRAVLLENVPGILSPYRGSDGKRRPAYALTIIGDLTALGYDCEWGTLFASDAGTPHLRERWVLVAYATRAGAPAAQQSGQRRGTEQSCANVADTNGDGQCRPQTRKNPRYEEQHHPSRQRGGGTEFHAAVPGGENLGNAASQGLSPRVGVRQRAHETQGGAGLVTEPERSSDGTGQPRPVEPVLGGVLDGLSRRMDRSRWPAPQGPFQYSWEPPRLAPTKLPYRKDRVEANGNAVVPQVFYPVAVTIHDRLTAQDAAQSGECADQGGGEAVSAPVDAAAGAHVS